MTREEFEKLVVAFNAKAQTFGAHVTDPAAKEVDEAEQKILDAWDAQASALAEARRALHGGLTEQASFVVAEESARAEAAESRAAEAHLRGFREGVEAAADALSRMSNGDVAYVGIYRCVCQGKAVDRIRALAAPGAPEACTCGPADVLEGGDGDPPHADCPLHGHLAGAPEGGEPR